MSASRAVERAREFVTAIETPHPLVEVAVEALDRGETATALVHIQSMVVSRDADARRLRRAEQALLAAQTLEVEQ